MQPQTPHKPVMDIAAPPKAPAPQPVAPLASAPAPVDYAEEQSKVLPAVESTSPLTVQDAPIPPETPIEAAAAMPTPPAPKPKAQQKAATVGPHAPVALITVTVLVMLLLSSLATVIYFTSQSS
jgi:hypothetical protein